MISVVLIEPENSANIGSVARVMANFGVNNLVLINPKCKINEESRRLAKNAQKILDKAKINGFNSLAKFDCLIGTTSKLGNDYNILRSPLTPDQLGKKLKEIKNRKIALILGRESDGLRNKEIKLCDFTVTIPTSRNYKALNISHAVGVLLYEIFKEQNTKEIMKPYTPISIKEKEQILKLLNNAMKKMDFTTLRKKDTQLKVWKRMISKSFMTKREAYALMGFLKKIK
ncbi:MAG: RNA methyltransferase [Nanoarchaeota archaeon]|nr:RNA methyltransferase [Nanoarchaeota archaeon]MBU1321227.1 RNA methyltransferase [Nanoarchaeota archaeon]MBU1597032.1 RNA methyltransferase [Nanoarchaeota archaeon]MBU2441822.1 RNA methyltransferase [Nanoarchaeota archaeon]